MQVDDDSPVLSAPSFPAKKLIKAAGNAGILHTVKSLQLDYKVGDLLAAHRESSKA